MIKTRYKTRMLTQMVNAAENFDELQVEAEKLPNGRKGLSYGLPAHVLDAANLLKTCWDELPGKTISACWRRSSVSRFLTQNLLNRSKLLLKLTTRFSLKLSKKSVAKFSVRIFSVLKISLNITQRHFQKGLTVGSGSRSLTSLGLDVITNATTEDKNELLERWLNLEKDPEIIDAEIRELSNEVEMQSSYLNSTACSESPSSDTFLIEDLNFDVMESDAAPILTETNIESEETNSLIETSISLPIDKTQTHLTEIEKIDLSRILESAKYMMEIAAESKNPILIEIAHQSYLKIRCDIQSKFCDF